MSHSARTRCLVRGSINIDEFFRVNDIARPGETISSTILERRSGGKGANQAVAVAKAGGDVSIIGGVGEDGLWVVERLKEAGVETSGITVMKVATGRAVIQLTPEGENCIILFPGANHAICPPINIHLLKPYTHVLLQNEIPFQDTLIYLSTSTILDITTIYNPSPVPSPEELRAIPWNNVRWLVVNNGEASALLKSLNGASESDSHVTKSPDVWKIPDHNPALETAFHTVYRLSNLSLFSSTNIICTLGPNGVLASLTSLPSPIYIPASILEGEVRDTTGSGDCFTGYLAIGLMELDTKEQVGREEYVIILKRCVQAAGMCVERRGAMESIPAREEVEARLRGQQPLTETNKGSQLQEYNPIGVIGNYELKPM